MKTGIEHELINIENLSYSYEKEAQILKDLNFSVKGGENVGLIGANGVGKSTLLKLLVGLNMGYQGKMMIAHHEMNAKNLKHIREHIGYVFQDSDSQLFMNTVEEDVAFGPKNYGLTKEEVEARVNEALEKAHITDLRKKHIYKLSGGEKKLAAIATILSMEPDIILMDEPSVALDPKNRRNLINLLNEMETTKVIASHDLDFIYDTCERTILLSDGQIVADGPTQEILLNKELLEENGLELPLSFSRG